MTQAVGYIRTSSRSNVGEDKDSKKRQEAAIQSYADHHDTEIVAWFSDVVCGADPIDNRPGFAAMLEYMAANEVTQIVLENASRFSRDLITQETGYAYLKKQHIDLIAADDPDAFAGDTPTAVLIRQILGAVSQFEKANLVAKLKGARERKRMTEGRCEGRKPAPDKARSLAQQLASQGWTLRAVAAELAQAGFLAPSGTAYGPSSVRCMLG